MTNKETFQKELTSQYETLFKNDPEYSYSASRTTPEALAEKMTNGLITGDANKDGKGISNTCKILKVKPTYKAIKEFLKA